MAELVKEFLVVFGERRRPVKFTLEGENDAKNEIAALLAATKISFQDVLDPAGKFYFQTQHSKWGLTDVVDHVPDGSTMKNLHCQ